MGLYSPPQNILCALEPPSLNLPIVSQNTPSLTSYTLRERCSGLVLQRASHVYSWLMARTSIFQPAKNTGWNGPTPA